MDNILCTQSYIDAQNTSKAFENSPAWPPYIALYCLILVYCEMLFLSTLSFSLFQGLLWKENRIFSAFLVFFHRVLLNIMSVLRCFHAKNLSTFPQIVTESIVTRRIRNIRSNAFYYIHTEIYSTLKYGKTKLRFREGL